MEIDKDALFYAWQYSQAGVECIEMAKVMHIAWGTLANSIET